MGAEDFSRFQQKAPGTFYYLGTNNPAKGCVSPNHSSRFKVDEDVLKYGPLSLATVALEFAARMSRKPNRLHLGAVKNGFTKASKDDLVGPILLLSINTS